MKGALFCFTLLLSLSQLHAEGPSKVECQGEQRTVKIMDGHLLIQDSEGLVKSSLSKVPKQKMAFGELYSVFLRAMPDLFVEYYSLVVPRMNFLGNNESVSFNTMLVLHKQNTSIAGTEAVNGLVDELLASEVLMCKAYK